MNFQPLRYIWAMPATVIGLVFASLAVIRGRIAVVDGVIEAQGPLLRWALAYLLPGRGGASAITLGHVVLARDAMHLEWTRCHERAHVAQYERWGPLFLPAYLVASLAAFVRGRDCYFDNRFEREARAVEALASSNDFKKQSASRRRAPSGSGDVVQVGSKQPSLNRGPRTVDRFYWRAPSPARLSDTPALASRRVLSSSKPSTVRPSEPNTASAGDTL